MPIVMALGNLGMKPRHWAKISDIVGYPIIADEDLTLKALLKMDLEDFIEQLESVSEAASKESQLENTMMKMEKEWQDMYFTISPYKESRTFLVSSVDDIQVVLDDHILKTMTMKNSPFIKPFEKEIA